MPHRDFNFPLESDSEVFRFIKAYQQVPKFITVARENTDELKALMRGIKFKELLVHKIEHLESEKKAEARRKYSRDIKDFWDRILRLLDNVYSATGGSKHYDLKGDQLKELLKALMNIRGGLSLEKWLEKNWMKLYHNDPSGVIFLEYDSERKINPFPTYKSIHNIRWYVPEGQKMKAILFEPEKPMGGGQIWRLVDGKMDYRVLQKGETFTIIDDLTFEHPFGQVPGMINSDIIDSDSLQRLSPIDALIGISREYSRDLSVKTIYKFKKGIPTDWRVVTHCKVCSGSGKRRIDEEGLKKCDECDGFGFYRGKDVTDLITIGMPKEGQTIPSPIAGSISPDLETLEFYTEELPRLEDSAHKTQWGFIPVQQTRATATEIILDLQPATARLNDYSDIAENMEKQLSEWIVNFQLPTKNKEEEITQVNYGRNFILEPVSIILEKYQKAKREGDNTVILDRLFNEYLTAKHKSDPVALRLSLLKAQVEPYLHYTLDQITDSFGAQEAQRKMLFEEWWKTLIRPDFEKTAEQLIIKFNEWFEKEIEKLKPATQPSNQNLE